MDITSLEQFTSLPEFTHGLLVVSFWATWSKPSLQMNAVVDQLQKQYPTLKFIKVQAEEVGEITEKYEVEAVPTIVFLKNGTTVDTLRGANPPELTKIVATFSQSAAVPPGLGEASQIQAPQENLNDRIKNLLNSSKVMGFIKGTPSAPQCGFSSKFCTILKEQGIQFSTFNILSDQAIREGLKKYSNWPTYPQLYINGELVGGLDIVKELAEQGELLQMVNGVVTEK